MKTLLMIVSTFYAEPVMIPQADMQACQAAKMVMVESMEKKYGLKNNSSITCIAYDGGLGV